MHRETWAARGVEGQRANLNFVLSTTILAWVFELKHDLENR